MPMVLGRSRLLEALCFPAPPIREPARLVSRTTGLAREVLLVATDGGCTVAGTTPRAGWGYADQDPRLGSSRGAVRGPSQTAQRREVCAATHVNARAPGRIFLVTDSQYVERRLLGLLRGWTQPCWALGSRT